MEQLSIIFVIFCAAGLKSNAPKSSLGINVIPYLDNVITREGIKLDTKKVLDIIDLGQPNTMT